MLFIAFAKMLLQQYSLLIQKLKMYNTYTGYPKILGTTQWGNVDSF
jgi:hypothetical protein